MSGRFTSMPSFAPGLLSPPHSRKTTDWRPIPASPRTIQTAGHFQKSQTGGKIEDMSAREPNPGIADPPAESNDREMDKLRTKGNNAELDDVTQHDVNQNDADPNGADPNGADHDDSTLDDVNRSAAKRDTAEHNSGTRTASPEAGASDTQVTVYSPDSKLRQPRELFSGLFADIWSSRELSWRLLVRNIRGLYRQTLLGLFWAFLPPVAQTAIWVFLQKNSVVSVDSPVPYVVYVLTGMILWQGFIDAFMAPLTAVNSGRKILSKINFPRESLLVVALGEAMFNLVIRSSLLIVVFPFFLTEWHWTMVLAPIGMLALVVLGTAMGLLIMPVGALYQDVNRFLTIATPFWMLLTPIVYMAPEEGWTSFVVWLNPVSPLLVATRDLILMGESTLLIPALITILVSLPLLLIGLVLYRLSMPILIERMNA